MADHVIFFGWKGTVPGREKQALALGQKATEFFTRMAKDDLIKKVQNCQLVPHGGDLNYFLIVSGEADKLTQVKMDPDFMDIVIEGGLCLEAYGVVDGVTGETATRRNAIWAKFIER